jgi:dethiobiotin synthetase
LFPLKNKIYLIAGTGTDIGKTFLVENFCRILREKKIPVSAIKPIISGFMGDDLGSDSARILKSLEREISLENLDEISPWRFEIPASPHFASKASNLEISFTDLINFCQKKIADAEKNSEFLLIETAGGIMTPINDDKTFLDLAQTLQIPILLVSANYLGTISHSLCALKALKSIKAEVEMMLMNNFSAEQKSSLIDEKNICKTLENLGSVQVETMTKFLLDCKLL